MAGRKANGEGSIYRRGDGRWAGSVFVDTISGGRKRIHVYANTRQEAHDRLADKLAEARKGIRTPDKEWTVGAYLDYWFNTIVAVKCRPRTVELYASTIRLYLLPTLGSIRLTKLTVQDVQTLLNTHLARGSSLRTVHQARGVLRAALNRAMREELLVRNVAGLVDLRAWKRKPVRGWKADEAARFLEAAKDHRWYPAYAMLLLYGMRRGEVLGLRWCDVDFTDGLIRVRQQLQRIGKKLEQGPVKTDAGQRDLPLIALLRQELAKQYVRRYGDQLTGSAMAEHVATSQELVFLSTAGTPIDPKNFVRAFHLIREKAGLPRITVHHTRHTAATMLKKLGVPVRDAQLILGHAHVTTTQQLYQLGDRDGQVEALAQIEAQVVGEQEQGALLSNTAVKADFSTGENTSFALLTFGGPSGARTLDTLLKSLMLSAGSTDITPVIRHMCTRVYAHICGQVAVKHCCQMAVCERDRASDLADWSAALRALRQVELDILRKRSFPLNLVPAIWSNSDPYKAEPGGTQGSGSVQERTAA